MPVAKWGAPVNPSTPARATLENVAESATSAAAWPFIGSRPCRIALQRQGHSLLAFLPATAREPPAPRDHLALVSLLVDSAGPGRPRPSQHGAARRKCRPVQVRRWWRELDEATVRAAYDRAARPGLGLEESAWCKRGSSHQSSQSDYKIGTFSRATNPRCSRKCSIPDYDGTLATTLV